MTTQERIIEYVAKCNEKTTYQYSKIDTTRLLNNGEYCKHQIYRYLSRYIAVDGEKMGDVIDLLKGIHYCYFFDCYRESPTLYDFKKRITNIEAVNEYITTAMIGERVKLDELVERFNLDGDFCRGDDVFRLLYDMLEEHYKQTEEWQST